MEDLTRALEEFEPEALVAYASVLEALAREAQTGRLRLHRLRQVTNISEPLSPGGRRLITSAFGLTVIDHYSCGSSLWGKAQKFGGVLRALRQSPARTIAIGDEIRDIDAARKAGLAAGSITVGYNSRLALEGHAPDFLFDDYEGLKRSVLG